MNRRNFFKALAVAPVVAVFGAAIANDVAAPDTEIRRVMFFPPGEQPAIYWTNGHMPVEHFVWMYEEADIVVPLEQVKYGWASRKLSGVSMCLSDAPLENFEPITYWIRADYAPTEKEVAAAVKRELLRAFGDMA